MSSELFRRARRAEAGAARVEDRRRLRLEFFRAVLAEGLDSLKAMHAEGASGEESVRAHARFIDGVVQSLTRLVVDDARRDGLTPTPLVVVALGGYGRGELHPSSDIDLMVVYDGEQTPFVQRVMQELLYALWDLGFQVGHSLRSLEDCVAMARTDFPSRTSMQEARLIAGDRPLFTRFRRVLRDNVYRHDFGEFLKMTLAERDQRYRKFGGSSPYIGEPNVKESAGALRDMHTAMWLGAAKFGTRTLRELSDKGLITPREQAGADAALTFLWRVRNELHFFTGHKNDVLTRDLQPRIAKNLGYENDGETLGVEQFMREYYLHARVIHRVSRRLIARCQETLSRRGSAERRERQQALADGLVFFDGRLHLSTATPARLRTDPVRIMKVFRHVHRLGCELSLGLERTLEDSLDAVDDGFRRSPVVRDLFLDICRSWGRVAPTLSVMHELGLLGRYLPEFGALTCLVQYDVYHKFSADQHSLLAVQHLEALAPGQSAESEGAAQVFNEVERPELLMLGMLLHDIGKAKGHGHVAKGIPLVQELGAADGLDAGRGLAGGVPRRASPDDVAHRPAARHRRPQDHRRLRDHGGRSPAPADALSADLRRHARGGARRAHRLAGRHPARALSPYARPPHQRPRGQAQPHPARRAAARGRDGRRAAAGGEGPRGDGPRALSHQHERAADGRAPAPHRAAGRRAGGHRAVPPSRPRHLRLRRGHPRRARGCSPSSPARWPRTASTSRRPRSRPAATASPSTRSRSTIPPARW